MSYDFSFSKKSIILMVLGCIAVGVLLFFAGFIIGLDKGQSEPGIRATLSGQNQPEPKTEPEKGPALTPSENSSASNQEQPSAGSSAKPAAGKSKEPPAPAPAESKPSEAAQDAKSSAPKEGEAKDPGKEKDQDKEKAEFSLQLGAFQTEDNALMLRDKFKAKGYSVFLFRVLDSDGHLWHTVRMGHYADMKQASQAAEKMTNKEQISTWVRPANAF